MNRKEKIVAEMKLKTGKFPRGEKNSITDINGIKVGHLTVNKDIQEASGEKTSIRTGLTAILPYQLKKMAKRVALGLAQTGAISGTGSGDIILAFSTANKIPRNNPDSLPSIKAINDSWITPLYQATAEATQEAIINALTSAKTIVGRDNNTAYGIPLDQVKQIMKKYLRIGEENHE